LTEEGAVLVMKATHGMGSLTSLNLAGNDITEDAVEPLLECLKCHTKLEELILDDNELEDGGAQALAEFLDGDATVLPRLKILSLCSAEMHSSGAKAIARAIAGGERSVKQVRLNGNAIGPKGLAELREVLGERNGEFDENEEVSVSVSVSFCLSVSLSLSLLSLSRCSVSHFVSVSVSHSVCFCLSS
jgi:Ran GTPase-activating protein (RanGAP) involved in mRNA processing and transport